MNKLEKLRRYFRSLQNCAIAYSGGVDSTFLLYIAHEILGENVIAVTVKSHSLPKRDFETSKIFCKEHKIKQTVISYNELEIPGFSENPKNRCYLCKKALFSKIVENAKSYGINTVCDGSNLSDTGDYRPGLQAISELGIKTPLIECELTKDEIRELSKEINLPTWNKPAAACLNSRIPYGEIITEKKLQMVENGEDILQDMGFSQLRVRIHGENLARIEVIPSELDQLLKLRNIIISKFKLIGFSYITMDLQGYRTGSMNEVIL